jgi:starvation-inducible DNA-binding protein
MARDTTNEPQSDDANFNDDAVLKSGFRNLETAAQPILNQRAKVLQKLGVLTKLPLGIKESTLKQSVENLNQVLADTIMLREMYKKHHWQVSGPTFIALHKLFDKHYEQQAELVDMIAERVQMLGGLALGMPQDVVANTKIERPQAGRESVPVQLSRLVEAHGIILKEVHEFAKQAQEGGDDGTNDLLVSDVMRGNEMQLWFLSEHLVDEPLVNAGDTSAMADKNTNGKGKHT